MLYNIDDLIKWYMSNGLAKAFKELNIERTDDLIHGQNIPNSEYNELVESFFYLMPFCNLNSKEYTITFENSGTDFIKQIFKDEVDNDTLVISTYYEHENVVKEVNNCKHTLLLKYDNDILQKGHTLQSIIDTAKKYKKVFVYIIGTQISTGQITPQQFLQTLKKKFIENNIKHKILLDDVHGMFMHPRDYSIFDYVLYTAHAIIPNYNMGMLISKNNNYGKKAFCCGAGYIKILSELLTHKAELSLFKNIMIEYFSDILANPEVSLYQNTVNHIFALRTENLYFSDKEYEELKKYGIVISEHHTPISFMRIRFQEFLLQSPEKAIEGLKKAKNCLIRAIALARLKGE